MIAKERILVIKLSAFGDFIVALGAMAAIRLHHPNAHITLLTTRPFVDMAERSGCFDEVWSEGRPDYTDFRHWFNLFSRLNQGRFNRVYDLQLNKRTSLYYHMFMKKPEWSGIVKNASHFYANPAWRQMHAFKRHQVMLKELGIDVALPDLSWMSSDVSLFRLKKPYVLLVPGSSPAWPQKRWPAIKYGALARKLILQGYAVAVIGGDADRDTIDRLMVACPEARDLSGKTSFYDIATLAREAAGAVGNDTGPSHLIAMAGCPIVTLFSGASSPTLSAPVGAAVAIIQSEDIADISVDDVMQNLQLKQAA